MIDRFIDNVKPTLIMFISTAGGCRPQDHLGTGNVVNAGTYYEPRRPRFKWPNYVNNFLPNWKIVDGPGFKNMLFEIPSTRLNAQTNQSHLQNLADQFNAFYNTQYTLDQLNPNRLSDTLGQPRINNLCPESTPLLTTSTFIVGMTEGMFKEFAVIEMDDAVIGKVCTWENRSFCYVRNVSDPAQNGDLGNTVDDNWGNAVYEAFGLYTSLNGALVAWAIINGQYSE